ncbi:MAG: hypothetical protein CM15mP49_20610 [Actinomycetota bacterium]|nr:MAG: hypothetical protein CM15mP49_20610 [Actinomycetota bacterium]
MRQSRINFTITKPRSGDVVAGLSVALLALPQGLAYAELAGMPAKYGLYAAAIPSLLAAIFRILSISTNRASSSNSLVSLRSFREPREAFY